VIARLQAALANGPMTPKRFVTEWYDVQGEAFSLMLAGFLRILPRTGIEIRDGDGNQRSADEVIDYLRYQFVSTLASLVAVPIPTIDALVFEPLLVRFLDAAPFFPSLAEVLQSKLEPIRKVLEGEAEGNIGLAPIRYVFFAMLAALSARMQTPNADEKPWARALVLHEWARRRLADDGYPSNDRLSVQSERAAATIRKEEAWDALAAIISPEFKALRNAPEALGDDLSHSTKTVEEIMATAKDVAEALGRPGLEAEIFATLTMGPIEPRQITDLLNLAASHLGAKGFGLGLQMFVGTAKSAADLDRVDAAVRQFLSQENIELELKASAFRWFGEQAKNVNRPETGFKLLGREPASWESQLSDTTRMRLWNERANLMRLAGDLENARDLYEKVLELCRRLDDKDDEIVALRNYAIILRDTGIIEESIAIFREVIRRSQGRDKAFACDSLAVSLMLIGQDLEAAALFSEARALLGAQDRNRFFQKLLLAEIGARLSLGQNEQAKKLAKSITAPEDMPYDALLPLVGVLSVFADKQYDLPNLDLENVIGIMEQRAEYLVGQGEYLVSQLLYRAAGLAALRHFRARAKSLMEKDLALSDSTGRPPSALSTIGMAAVLLEENEIERSMEHLWRLPIALAGQFGSVGKQVDALDALAGLGTEFDRLTTAAVDSGMPIEHLPFIADAQRNPLQKARFVDTLVRTKGSDLASVGPPVPGDAVQFVQQGVPPFCVIEFLQSNQYFVPLLTRVSASHATTEALDPLNVNLRTLSRDIRFRLETWRVGRPGDPFDYPAWRAFEDWLRLQIDQRVEPGSHIILMDEARHDGLPAHAAVQPPWSVSYAADWRAVVESAEAAVNIPTPTTLGVVTIPTANESVKMKEIFKSAGASIDSIGRSHAFKIEHLSDTAASQDTLARLFEHCDAVKIVCHGYLVTETQEVVLLVARDGKLPARTSVGIGGAAARGFRMGWNEFSSLKRMPRTVFLGVCGGGATNVRGLQERVGLFSPMSNAGTRALVAPRWKIHAPTVLPIIDAIFEMWACSGKPLSHIVRDIQVSTQEAGCARWHAASLALEGVWL